MAEKRAGGQLDSVLSKRHRSEFDGESPNEIQIPQQYVGWLKGAHGRQIVDIETRSGAHVSIDQTTKELGYSKAMITGSDEAVAMAAEIINSELQRVMERDNYSTPPVACGPNETTEEVQIPQKYVGWLKGSNGSQLRELEAKSGAYLRIDQSTRDQGYSIAQITGQYDAVMSCKSIIDAEMQRVQERDRAVESSYSNSSSGHGRDGNSVLEIEIPQQYIGWIKGSGGSQIKDMEHRSGAHIAIDQSSQGRGYSICKLIGTQEAVHDARRMIESELSRVMDRDKPTSATSSRPPPLTQVRQVLAPVQPWGGRGHPATSPPPAAGGTGGGTDGSKEALTAVATLVAGLVGVVAAAKGGNVGADVAQALTTALSPALAALAGPSKAPTPLSASPASTPPPAVSSSGAPREPNSSAPAIRDTRQPVHTLDPGDDGQYDTVQLPNACVGWLKGKQGGMIRDIESRSGAQVEIDQSTKESGYSCARISCSDFHHKKIAHGLVVAEVMKVMDQSGEPCDVGVKVDFRIDAQYVGWVKGPRGKVVQEIQVKTGTRVDVDQKTAGGGLAIVKVYGTLEGTEMARKLIANELSKISPEEAEMIVIDLPGGLEAAKEAATKFNGNSYAYGPGGFSSSATPPPPMPSPSSSTARPPLANPSSQLSMRDLGPGHSSQPVGYAPPTQQQPPQHHPRHHPQQQGVAQQGMYPGQDGYRQHVGYVGQMQQYAQPQPQQFGQQQHQAYGLQPMQQVGYADAYGQPQHHQQYVPSQPMQQLGPPQQQFGGVPPLQPLQQAVAPNAAANPLLTALQQIVGAVAPAQQAQR